MDEENIFVISKEHAIEILSEKTKSYFSGDKVKNNVIYLTAWLLIVAVIGITCLSTAILLIITGPFFLLEYIIRKIFNRGDKVNENNYAIDEE